MTRIALSSARLPLSAHVCLERFVRALLLWGKDPEVFIARLCGMESLKCETPRMLVFVVLFSNCALSGGKG